jgi:hypothetical protein
VRNKIRQGWKQQVRHQRIGQLVGDEAPGANIIYPDFEMRSDLERIRTMIVEMNLSNGERAVADVYLDHFPDRPDFQSLRNAMPSRSEKGVRNAEARFMCKLQQGLGA